jgi:hypothetical protein
MFVTSLGSAGTNSAGSGGIGGGLGEPYGFSGPSLIAKLLDRDPL